MRKVHIKDLRWRVALQRNTPTRDSSGGEVESWATLASVWAKVEHLQNIRETETSGLDEAAQRIRVTVRYYAGILTDDRIQFDGQEYDILNVQHAEQNRWTQIVGEVRGQISGG